jgi:hypothetical protein
MQSEVSLAPGCAKDFRIDALSVIPDAKAELLFLISNFHFDVPRPRVPEGVSQSLSSNAVNFLSSDRMQIPRLAFNLYAEGGRDQVAFRGREFFAECLYGRSKIISLGSGRA